MRFSCFFTLFCVAIGYLNSFVSWPFRQGPLLMLPRSAQSATAAADGGPLTSLWERLACRRRRPAEACRCVSNASITAPSHSTAFLTPPRIPGARLAAPWTPGQPLTYRGIFGGCQGRPSAGLRTLDSLERHHLPQGGAIGVPLCLQAMAGVWGQRPLEMGQGPRPLWGAGAKPQQIRSMVSISKK